VKYAAFASLDLRVSLTFNCYWHAEIRIISQGNRPSARLAERCAGKWKGKDVITIGEEAATLGKLG
jgi:hypothetical protein